MRLVLIAALCLLTACVMPGGKPGAKPAANPITGDAIATETLDAPAPGKAEVGAKAEAKVIGKDKPKATPVLDAPVAQQVDASLDAISAPSSEKPEAEAAAVAVKDDPAKASATDPEPPAVAEEKPAAPPPVPQSPAEAKCLKSGGTWATAGKGEAKACVRRTRDGGKSCTRQTQCEGYCLARSGSCAPITPMFGCNDILQADGRRVTLCLD